MIPSIKGSKNMSLTGIFSRKVNKGPVSAHFVRSRVMPNPGKDVQERKIITGVSVLSEDVSHGIWKIRRNSALYSSV